MLAVMLLAGCFGAMLPVWMKLDPSVVDGPSGGRVTKSVEEEGVADRSSSSEQLQSTGVSAWKVNSSLVVMTGISCGCLIAFSLSWELYASVIALIGFFASWQFINVVFYARIATCISEAGARYSQLVRDFRNRKNSSSGSGSNLEDRERSPSSVEDIGGDIGGDIGRRSLLGPVRSSDSFGVPSSHLSVTMHADDGIALPAAVDAFGSHEPDQSLTEELPPYSVSIIFLVTASVLFQVVVQIVLFSSLQLSLQSVSVILTLLFCVFSFIYCLDILRFHCWQSHTVTG